MYKIIYNNEVSFHAHESRILDTIMFKQLVKQMYVYICSMMYAATNCSNKLYIKGDVKQH